VSGCQDRYRDAEPNGEEPIFGGFWVIENSEVIGCIAGSELLREAAKGPGGSVARTSRRKVFTPAQVGLASFFGSALAGFYMLVANYSQFSKQRSAHLMGLIAAVVLPALIAAIVMVPDSSYDRLFPLLSGLVMGGVAYALQGRAIAADIQER